MLANRNENLIDELPHASSQRVEEILSILKGVLSEVECKFSTEDDTDIAYKCLNIPEALHIITLIKALNTRDIESNSNKKDGFTTINDLSVELKIIFKQIPLV